MLVAFKLYHCVYNMLQYLRTGQGALLVDMSYQYHRYVAALAETQQGRGTFTHLTHTAWTALHILRADSLDGVYDHQLWHHIPYVTEYLLQ